MKIKDKETYINFNIKLTESNTGISSGDVWCYLECNIKNDEIDYELKQNTITKQELIKTIDIINNFISDYTNEKIAIEYIKNYFKLKLYEKNNDKILEVKIIEPYSKKRKFKTYTLNIINDEILELLNNLKNTKNLYINE